MNRRAKGLFYGVYKDLVRRYIYETQELDFTLSEYGSDIFSEKYQIFIEVNAVKRPIIIT